MMGISLGHIIILLVIVLLFGGKRLPELGASLGKGLRSFKEGLDGKLDDNRENLRVEAPRSAPTKSDSDHGENKA